MSCTPPRTEGILAGRVEGDDRRAVDVRPDRLARAAAERRTAAGAELAAPASLPLRPLARARLRAAGLRDRRRLRRGALGARGRRLARPPRRRGTRPAAQPAAALRARRGRPGQRLRRPDALLRRIYRGALPLLRHDPRALAVRGLAAVPRGDRLRRRAPRPRRGDLARGKLQPPPRAGASLALGARAR